MELVRINKFKTHDQPWIWPSFPSQQSPARKWHKDVSWPPAWISTEFNVVFSTWHFDVFSIRSRSLVRLCWLPLRVGLPSSKGKKGPGATSQLDFSSPCSITKLLWFLIFHTLSYVYELIFTYYWLPMMNKSRKIVPAGTNGWMSVLGIPEYLIFTAWPLRLSSILHSPHILFLSLKSNEKSSLCHIELLQSQYQPYNSISMTQRKLVIRSLGLHMWNTVTLVESPQYLLQTGKDSISVQ